jgi:hypothetical protein
MSDIFVGAKDSERFTGDAVPNLVSSVVQAVPARWAQKGRQGVTPLSETLRVSRISSCVSERKDLETIPPSKPSGECPASRERAFFAEVE